MSTSDSLLVSEVISAYGSLRLDASLSIATTALLFYDAFLTSEKEYDYVWRTPRKWHQRVIYTLNKYTVLLGSALALGTIYPISDRSCAALNWIISTAGFLGPVCCTIFTVLRSSALSGRNPVFTAAVSILGCVVTACNAIFAFYSRPANLPPPANCTVTDSMSGEMSAILNIVTVTCVSSGILLATIVTWRQTRSFSRQLGTDQPSLVRILWAYGMIYFCALFSLNIADSVLSLLSVTQDGTPWFELINYANQPFASILTTRFLLDIYEAEARRQRGGALDTGSVTLDFGGDADRDRRRGSLSVLEFVASYGGPVYSPTTNYAPSVCTQESGQEHESQIGVVSHVEAEVMPVV